MKKTSVNWFSFLISKGVKKSAVTDVLIGRLDKDSISLVFDAISADIINRHKLKSDGETQVVSRGLALSDAKINELAFSTLSLLIKYKEDVPPPLLNVIKKQLKIAQFEEEKLGQFEVAAYLVARHPEAGNRKISEIIGCNHVTLSRWKKETRFRSYVETWENNLDDTSAREALLFAPYWARIDTHFK